MLRTDRQTDKQTDSKLLPTPTDIVGVGDECIKCRWNRCVTEYENKCDFSCSSVRMQIKLIPAGYDAATTGEWTTNYATVKPKPAYDCVLLKIRICRLLSVTSICRGNLFSHQAGKFSMWLGYWDLFRNELLNQWIDELAYFAILC